MGKRAGPDSSSKGAVTIRWQLASRADDVFLLRQAPFDGVAFSSNRESEPKPTYCGHSLIPGLRFPGEFSQITSLKQGREGGLSLKYAEML